MQNRYRNKTVLITGAASGIGSGLARAFAEEGATLVLLDVEAPALNETAETIAQATSGDPVRVYRHVVDVADRGAMKRVADRVRTEAGAIDILCNNAGVGYADTPLDQVPDDDWDWVIGVNLMGVVNGLQAFLPLVKKAGPGGHIVNTASIGGHHVMPGWGYGVYTTTKFALVGLSEALADDLADQGIGVSVLCPAAVDTAIYDGGRNRPAAYGGPFGQAPDHPIADALKDGMKPIEVGHWALRGIEDRQFYIFPHAHTQQFIDRRHDRISSAFAWAARVAPEIVSATQEARQ